MKNIHILPTDQPSRLHYYYSLTPQYALSKEPLNWRTASHIYITSDEEIKEGDWGVDDENVLTKFCTHFAIHSQTYFNYRKVTLTTDPTLIADGVQAIDDDFLEWFVKNSSCEFVNLDSICKCVACDSSIKSSCDYAYKCKPQIFYKITIPQEEPKQEKEEEYFKHLEKDKKEFAEEWEEIRQEFGFGKKDTLEEAADKYANEWEEIHPTLDPEDMTPIEVSKIDFIAGAKWQAEQLFKDDAIQTLEKGLALLLKKQERMYSEEDLREAFKQSRQCKIFEKDMPPVYETFEEWFEQFKK